MQITSSIDFFTILKILALVVVGFLLARFSSHAAEKFLSKYASSQQTMLMRKFVYFSILTLFMIMALQELGFRLSVLLGSAGIATAAIAFASQTSISNMISGVFLILEKSLRIGDQITIGKTTGTIASVDLLSVKILTANNTLVRIPNETLIKSEITNVTRFDSRRLQLSFFVAANQDFEQVKKTLLTIVAQNHHCLSTPLPAVTINHLEDSGMDIELTVWVAQENYYAVKQQLLESILQAFRNEELHFATRYPWGISGT